MAGGGINADNISFFENMTETNISTTWPPSFKFINKFDRVGKQSNGLRSVRRFDDGCLQISVDCVIPDSFCCWSDWQLIDNWCLEENKIPQEAAVFLSVRLSTE